MTDSKKIGFLPDYAGKISYAMYENSIPIIRRLSISNNTDEDIQNGVINITFAPQFSDPVEMEIPSLPAGRAVDLGEVDSKINTDFILSLTGITKGEMELKFTLGNLSISEKYSVEIEPYDLWPGVNDLPEITAAFSIPEHPVITGLLTKTSENLGKISGDSNITGYLDASEQRVLEELSAMFSSVKELNISGTSTAEGYTEQGQKIRLLDEIMDTRLASSLDLTMLYSSLMEKAGLNPVVILMENRALPGAWLKDESFPETVTYDVTSLNKRVAEGINRIAVLDTQDLLGATSSDFNKSLSAGESILGESDKFVCAIDIRRARKLNIKPLPIRTTENGRYIITRPVENIEVEPVKPNEKVIISDEEVQGEKLPKQKVWERKLLDLSLRNNLLNFKRNRNSIALAVTDISGLEDHLSSGNPLRVMGYNNEQGESTGEEVKETFEETMAKLKKLSDFEFKSGRVRAVLDSEQLAEKARKISRASKVSMDETGSNTLFLSLGLLKWYDRFDKKNERLAPIVLIPVDITDRASSEGFTLKIRDEEAVFNITLLEFLLQEFGIKIFGLDPLPMDATGPDLLKIFSIIRRAIMGEKSWDVLEEAHLGLFSFSKFIMWNDLKSNMEEFSKNKIVSSLLEGKLTFEAEGMDYGTTSIDDIYSPGDVLYPVSSDASQSVAVMAAKEGKSFVLHGPPGTGKSQTITNIIANALMDGKRVLFVAQKMAALEVVQRRLDSIGIRSFCLELHSNKANKTAVLNQLERSLKIAKIGKSEEYKRKSDEIKARKDELNSIVQTLYKRDESGYSIYDLISEDSKTKSVDKYIELPINMDTTDIRGKKELLKKTGVFGSYAGGPYRNPLTGIGFGTYRPSMKDEIIKSADANWKGLDIAFGRITDKKSGVSPDSYNALLSYIYLLENIEELKKAAPQISDLSDIDGDINGLTQAVNAGEKLLTVRDGVAKTYGTESVSLDPDKLSNDLKEAENRFVLTKLFVKNPVLKELSRITGKDQISKEYTDRLIKDLNVLKAVRLVYRELLDKKASRFKELSGFGEKIPDPTRDKIDNQKNVLELLSKIKDFETDFDLKSVGNVVTRPGFESDYEVFKTLYEKEKVKAEKFLEETNFIAEDIEVDSFENKENNGNGSSQAREITIFGKVALAIPELTQSLDGLKDYLAYKNAEKEAKDAGLAVFTDEYRKGILDETELGEVYSNSILRTMLMKRLDEEPELVSMTGKMMEDKVRELKAILSEFETLQKKMLYYQLAGKVPNLVLETATSKEIGIIQKALRSGARDFSIRNLFSQTDQILSRITPCMLMSPMSVAQYLKADSEMFDLVIFDEASQLPTPEAVGSLGRGKAAVIVGDPKQLPPTSFFMSTNFDEENPENEDLDNILEDALALSVPESYLLWHYRSRHESLIAFSNKNFYENRLYTYPSPDDLTSKVTMKKNDGIYDRGGRKVNEVEAKEVVAEIKRRLMDPKLSKYSLGVVTFSSVQQTLIEDLLDKALAEDIEFSNKMDSMAEPVFVKNLENVQGDERDVILFSVGYGKDKDGKLSLNFGPINQEGGWRRLNVAVTRARYEMMVFTNITPSQFNVSKMSSRGVSDLKAFLEYAERGQRSLSLKDIKKDMTSENLNTSISESLRDRGYKVVNTIGSSKFKVDLAVVDPDRKEEYILGIMCGGESYRDARACYDREILQKSVLNGLGWDMYNVFPIDWFENQEKETDRIVQLIEEIRIRKKSGESQDNSAENPDKDSAILNNSEIKINGTGEDELPSLVSYRMNDLKGKQMTADEFLKVSNAGEIRNDLMAIIEAEGPLSLSLLARRIKNAYSLVRVTDKIEKQVEMILNSADVCKYKEGNTYYYMTKEMEGKGVSTYRKTLPDDKERRFTDIAQGEIKAALHEMVKSPYTEKALIKEITGLFGYPRLTADTESYIKNIIDIELLDGRLGKNGEGLIISKTK